MIDSEIICPLCGRHVGQYSHRNCMRPTGQVGCMRCTLTGHVLPDVYPYFPYGSSVPHCRSRRTFTQ